LSDTKKVPFRKWYGCLGELNSLIPKGTQMMALTATATKATKLQIMEILKLTPKDTLIVQQSPDRPNLFYSTQYMDKNDQLEVVFGALINELQDLNIDAPRTLIYCQTRKQCSVLFRMFEVFLGSRMFRDGCTRPQNRLVEMFHAGTPKQVKEHICENMTKVDGHLRVVICTVAFGMGINCRQVRRVIHFGPSKTVEQYVQECGRAGRDGFPSCCVLLYNGILSALCDKDMKTYIQQEGCCRAWLMSHFDSFKMSKSTLLHKCCGFCALKCNCQAEECGVIWSPTSDSKRIPCIHTQSDCQYTRVVTQEQKKALKTELYSFQKELFEQVDIHKMVTCPNILMEFKSFHINQVLQHCNVLFTINDILHKVEIWRMQYAIGIQQTLQTVFDDMFLDNLQNNECMISCEMSNYSDWSQIKDDSTLNEMINSQDLEDLSSFNFCMDTIDSTYDP